MAVSDHFDLIKAASGTGPAISVFLYPNTSSVKDTWLGSNDPVTEAVIDGAQQLYNGCPNVDWYEVWRLKSSETYPDSSASTKSEFSTGFEDYLKNGSGTEYYNYSGVHYGVAEGFDGGGGAPVYELKETGFETKCWMVIGAGSFDIDRAKTFTKQEMLHGYVAYDDVRDNYYMKHDIDRGHEHDPGQVDSNGNVSPFVITYSDTHAGHPNNGDSRACNNGVSSASGYDPNYTDCTKAAVDDTAYLSTQN